MNDCMGEPEKVTGLIVNDPAEISDRDNYKILPNFKLTVVEEEEEGLGVKVE